MVFNVSRDFFNVSRDFFYLLLNFIFSHLPFLVFSDAIFPINFAFFSAGDFFN